MLAFTPDNWKYPTADEQSFQMPFSGQIQDAKAVIFRHLLELKQFDLHIDSKHQKKEDTLAITFKFDDAVGERLS